MTKDPEKVAMGKKSRRRGLKFEREVKKDLESKGWIVTKWNNNLKDNPKGCGKVLDVYGEKDCFSELKCGSIWNTEPKKTELCPECAKLKPVASKPGPFRQMQTGFPDFMAFKPSHLPNLYEVDFIECKVNGRMKKEENAKAQWYLNSNYCNEFWIASLDDNGDIYYNNKKGEEI